MRHHPLLALALLLAGCPERAAPARPVATTTAFEDWYPQSIEPPPGVQYPCAVTALPRDLEGVPPEERRYVNHVYAIIIGVVQAKQALLGALANDVAAVPATHGAYRDEVARALERLAGEPVPEGLEPFHADVREALELHRAFFDEAARQRAAGGEVGAIFEIPQGRAASAKLHHAWGAMQARYRGWPPALKDSVFHHLCALDLF
jgi:hypothetical protein